MSHANKFAVMVADYDEGVAKALTGMLKQWYSVAPPVIHIDRLEAAVKTFRPLILLLDVIWFQAGALSRKRALLQAYPEMIICIISGHPVASLAAEATRAGAHGYLVKPLERDELHAAMETLLAGKAAFAPALCAAVGIGRDDPFPARPVVKMRVHDVGSPEHLIAVAWLVYDLRLTHRQAEVALGIHDGLIDKEIAARLGCSLPTVRKHVEDIYERLESWGGVNHGSVATIVEQSLRRRPKDWRQLAE